MAKDLPKEAVPHIVERPRYLDTVSAYGRLSRFVYIGEALKMIEATKCLSYDVNEWEAEHPTKNSLAMLRTYLKKIGLKPRVVKDGNKIYIWTTKV